MIQELDDKRVLLEYGPINMLLDIMFDHKRQPELAFVVSQHIVAEFNQLLPYMAEIKRRKRYDVIPEHFPAVLKRMINAVQILGDENLTPLAAVAGAFADLALEKAVELGATRVIINNGGDIALLDLNNEPINVGIPVRGTKDTLILTIKSEQNIRGICTSGIGGRSFTKGIANAAVALASNASIADACATHLGNETNTEDSNIIRCYAEEIDSGTDIPGHLVTLKVGRLSRKAIFTALLNGLNAAEKLIKNKVINGAIICVGNEIAMIPEGIAM